MSKTGQRTELGQKQRQRLLPWQLLLVPMLEKTGAEVLDFVKNELDANPALEVKEEPEEKDFEKTEDGKDFRETSDEMQRNDYGDDDQAPMYNGNNRSRDDDYYESPAVAEETLGDYLMSQVREREITDKEQLIAIYIIGNLDDDGYLRRSPHAIADDITFSSGVEVETKDVKEVLSMVYELDPPGVGAVDLRECILFQLKRFDNSPSNELAYTIVDKYFNEFSHKHYDKICTALNITESQLKLAIDVIKKVNPKPGSAFASTETERRTQQVTPDFEIEIDDADPDNPELTMTLVNNIPELQISESYSSVYQKMMQRADKKAAQKSEDAFVKYAYDQANDFISLLRRRQEKLMLTMEGIMHIQREFFLTGDDRKLKPMVLKDIAEITGLDPSVISRVTSSKYVTTPWGVFTLKHFFSEGLMHDDGEEVSTREICSVLKELIEGEDKHHPLSDEKLCEELTKRGYNVARRTVAKYRERLKFPVARLRKEM